MLKNRSEFITSDNRKKVVQKAIEKIMMLLIFDDGFQDRHHHYDFSNSMF